MSEDKNFGSTLVVDTLKASRVVSFNSSQYRTEQEMARLQIFETLENRAILK